MKKIFFIGIIIGCLGIIIGCLNKLKPEEIHEYIYELGYDISNNIPIWTNYKTNEVLIISNIVYIDEPFNDYEGKAKMDGIYLSAPQGTYNGAKIRTENNIDYWCISVGSLMFNSKYVQESLKIMGNIYTEKAHVTFLSNCKVNSSFKNTRTQLPVFDKNYVYQPKPSSLKDSKVFEVILRGSDYRQKFNTNIVYIYDNGKEQEEIEWVNNIQNRGKHLNYWEYENNWYGGQTLVQRFKNGEITSGYNIRLPKAGRNSRWRNRRNNEFLGVNPYRDLYLVKAFNNSEAIFMDLFTEEFVAITIKHELRNKPGWMGWDNQKNNNMKVLSIALPKSYWQGSSGGRYSILNKAWKDAALVAINTLTENYSEIGANLINMLKNINYENNGYESMYKELSISISSPSGYLYSNYFWDINSIAPWGFMEYVEHYTDEYGHLIQ